MVKDETSFRPRLTFSKEERLSGKKLIDELFRNGSFFYLYPFKVQFLEYKGNASNPVQVLMAVPSRNFPLAVDRNLIKRRMREAYRLNKQELYDSLARQQKKKLVALIYTARKSETFDLITRKMNIILKRIAEYDAPASKITE